MNDDSQNVAGFHIHFCSWISYQTQFQIDDLFRVRCADHALSTLIIHGIDDNRNIPSVRFHDLYMISKPPH